jgi:ADP-ribose pyrophosphatase
VREGERLSSRVAYSRGRFRVLEDRWVLADGTHDIVTLVKSPSFSVVVALTEDYEIPLVRNLHPSPGLHLLELPGGRIEPRETARSAAKRELEEETGWRCEKLTRIGRYYPNPHWGTFQGHFFFGERLRKGRHHPDPGESLRPVLLGVEDVYSRFREGRFYGGSTLVGLRLAEDRLRRMGVLADA